MDQLIKKGIWQLGLGFLDLLAPNTCVVCQKPAGWQNAYPLCAECKANLLGKSYARLSGFSFCKVCGKALISEQELCLRCRKSIYCFDSIKPLFRYDGEIRDVILVYKMGSRRSLAAFLAGLVYEEWLRNFDGRPLLPIPPRPKKLKRKGWDQVEDMSRILEKKYKVPVLRILKRFDGTEQKALGYEARQSNIKGKFYLRSKMQIPENPVLFDDVFTTGATLSECARVLKAASALKVDAICLAAD
ncbi:ComF family protein [Spirochaetota bacterium]